MEVQLEATLNIDEDAIINGVLDNIDMGDIASQVAENIDVRDIANELDYGQIDVDYDELAGEVDLDELARHIDVDEAVRSGALDASQSPIVAKLREDVDLLSRQITALHRIVTTIANELREWAA